MPEPSLAIRLTPREIAGFGLVIAVALIARLWKLDADSMWFDEAASWWFAMKPLDELWSQVPLYEPNPPLYYTLLKGWSAIFGTSESGLRSLSVLASLLAIPLVYLMGRTVIEGRDGHWVGLFAAVITALHPMQIHYAQEARPYALLLLAVTMIMLGSLRLLAVPRRAATPETLSTGPKRWSVTPSRIQAVCLLVGGTVLALWLHNTSILLVGTVVGVALCMLWMQSPRRIRLVATVALLGAIVLLLWARNIPWILHSMSSIRNDFWIPVPTRDGILYVVDMLVGSMELASSNWQRVLIVGVTMLVAAAGGLRLILHGQWQSAVFLGCAFILPLAACVVASFVVTPIFLSRTVVWTEIPFFLLFAAGVLWIRAPAIRVAVVLAIVAALVVITLLGLARSGKEPWRNVATVLEKEVGAGDSVVLYPTLVEIPLQYYRITERTQSGLVVLPAPLAGNDNPWNFRIERETLVQLQTISNASPNVWLISRRSAVKRDNPVEAALGELRGAPQVKFESGNIRVLKY